MKVDAEKSLRVRVLQALAASAIVPVFLVLYQLFRYRAEHSVPFPDLPLAELLFGLSFPLILGLKSRTGLIDYCRFIFIVLLANILRLFNPLESPVLSFFLLSPFVHGLIAVIIAWAAVRSFQLDKLSRRARLRLFVSGAIIDLSLFLVLWAANQLVALHDFSIAAYQLEKACWYCGLSLALVIEFNNADSAHARTA